MISDRATIAYLGDVFILSEYRGLGISKWLMECILSHPDLKDLRRWILATRDAHGLYSKFGFRQLKKPEYSWSVMIRTSIAAVNTVSVDDTNVRAASK